MSTPQYIYVMKDLRKVVPPNREVLKGIWLSFFPGAKIGVVGANGSGKSSLLRIMAGVDTAFQGEAWPARGTRVGYLPQEPRLEAQLNVRENVELAVAPVRALLRRFDDINQRFAEPMTDEAMSALLEEQARVQDQIDAAGAWEIDLRIEIAPPAAGEYRRRHLVGRRAAPRRALPRAAGGAGPAPARRADEPPGCGVRGLARASSRRVQGDGRGHHA
jgi:ATPase subunit of ABC transporter with duplicated ATPase domains